MSGSHLETALDNAREQYAAAEKEWLKIGNEIANSSPEQRGELEGLLAQSAEHLHDVRGVLADLQSEYVAETYLERYGDDQEKAICQGKSLEEAIEVADLNLYNRLTGHDHMGERESLSGDVAFELDARFGKEVADAYEQQRGDHAQEQTIEQDQSRDPGMER